MENKVGRSSHQRTKAELIFHRLCQNRSPHFILPREYSVSGRLTAPAGTPLESRFQRADRKEHMFTASTKRASDHGQAVNTKVRASPPEVVSSV